MTFSFLIVYKEKSFWIFKEKNQQIILSTRTQRRLKQRNKIIYWHFLQRNSKTERKHNFLVYTYIFW